MTAQSELTHHLTPPTPDEGWFGGHILQYHGNPLPFLLQNMNDYGGIAHFRVFKYHFYQINDPDLIGQVLVKKAKSFHKSALYKKVLGEYLGNGLLISDGDFWKRQRKLSQPAFHTGRIHTYADTMVDYTLQLRDQWSDGEVVNIAEDMMRLTLFIVAKTLFHADVSKDAKEVGNALDVLLHQVIEASRRVVRLPDWVPTPQKFRKQHAIETLNTITMNIINERRASGEDTGDLLSMLLMVRDDDGVGMTDEEVRDEVLTLFLAGHETTANAITWSFYLLSQHPDVEARVVDEIQTVLGDRPPTLDDLRDLPYTLMVFKEAMRLYPPAWAFSRQAIEDVEIGDYTIPKKWDVLVVPYVVHRNPDIWDDPEKFDPERFSADNEKQIPRHAYLPFGGGARVCIGNSFALMEGHLVLATLLQHYKLELVQKTVEPEPLVTLRPKGGLHMRVIKR